MSHRHATAASAAMASALLGVAAHSVADIFCR
ncbi:Ms4533A family Cys-rich leader peptide [Streptomyces sp. CA-243310]